MALATRDWSGQLKLPIRSINGMHKNIRIHCNFGANHSYKLIIKIVTYSAEYSYMYKTHNIHNIKSTHKNVANSIISEQNQL